MDVARDRVAVIGGIAMLAVAGAALLAEERTLGPGRVLCGVLVATWALCALFVVVRRPTEPLATLMSLVALAGAALVLGAALHARPAATEGAQDVGASMRAIGLAALPAIGLHLALALPSGVLGARRRRAGALVGYAAAVAVALVLVADRPHLRPALLGAEALAMATGAVIGFVARSRSVTSVRDRLRMGWVTRAAVVAVTVGVGAWVLHALASWPAHVRVVALAATVVVPLSLALGSTGRIETRSPGGLEADGHGPGLCGESDAPR